MGQRNRARLSGATGIQLTNAGTLARLTAAARARGLSCRLFFSRGFLPAIENSISRWPSIRFLPRFAFAGFLPAACSVRMLLRKASMRLMTLAGSPRFGASILMPFDFFSISSRSAAS